MQYVSTSVGCVSPLFFVICSYVVGGSIGFVVVTVVVVVGGGVGRGVGVGVGDGVNYCC